MACDGEKVARARSFLPDTTTRRSGGRYAVREIFTGGSAESVKELTAGAKAYLDYVNAKGGVHGRKIVLESMDDGFDPKRTPEVVKKLIEEKNVFAMFLTRGTPHTENSYAVLEAAKVPLIAPSSGAMSMYDPPRKYLFPVRASYHSETAKIVPQLLNIAGERPLRRVVWTE